MKKVAVVTGANRGIGFETCRQLAKQGIRVVLTARDPEKGQAAASRLSREIPDKGQDKDQDVVFHRLDVTNAESIRELRQWLEDKYGRLDILVNNAGILPGSQAGENSAMSTRVETLRLAMETNTYGPFLLCQQMIPLMAKNNYGRIVNLSSGLGQLSEMNGGYAAYRLSKTALNAITRVFADEVKTLGVNILINSVCPGWVKTDMGGPNAEIPVEEGADTVVWLATLPDGGPSGGFFRERKPIAW